MESRVLTGAMVLLTLALAAAATLGTVVAALACVVSVLILALAVLGRERVAVLAFAGSFGTAPMYRGIGGVANVATPTDMLMVLGLVLLVPGLLRRESRLPAAYVMGLVVLAITGLLGSVVNPAPVVSIVFVLQWLLCLGVLPVAFAMWRPGRAVVNGLLWCYLAGQMVSLAVAMAEGAAANGRYDGLAHHPNDFGLAGAVAIAIILYLFWSHETVAVRVVLAGLMLASVASVVISGSRGATLAVAAVVVLVPLVERSGVWAFLVGVGCAFGLALLPYLTGIGGAGGSLGRLTGDATAEYSDSLRETALSEGWQRFLGSPFIGTGIDNVIGEYHNVFLEVAAAVGIFGLGAYLVVFWVLTWPLIGQHPLRRLSYLPATFLVAGITFPGLVDRTVAVPMALAILAVVKATPVPAEEPVRKSVRNPVGRPLASQRWVAR